MRVSKKLFFVVGFAVFAAVQSEAQAKYDPPADIQLLLMKNACSGCHKPSEKLVGPSYLDLSKKKYSNEKIVELVHNPKPGDWPGYPPMAALPSAPKSEVIKIATWINTLRKKA